jgi:hypothetical protein
MSSSAHLDCDELDLITSWSRVTRSYSTDTKAEPSVMAKIEMVDIYCQS